MNRAAFPDQAMVFAAGRGSRMMPLTADRPKPMLTVQGKPLLGHALDRLAEAGVGRVVVNAHHCADVVAAYLTTRQTPSQISLSREEKLLETGGAVKKALADGLLAADAPLLTVNGDILWTDAPGKPGALDNLLSVWRHLGNAVDVLLLLVPRDRAWGHESPLGDYAVQDEKGRIRRLSRSPAPTVYTGVQMTRPGLYQDPSLGDCFSNLKIFDQAEAKGRLFGVVHGGGWFHFSTPESLQRFHKEHDA